MPLEQLVTNLELSKRLYELGVRKESIFHWHDGETIICPENKPNMSRSIPAYTSAELGDILPFSVVVDGKVGYLTIIKDTEEDSTFFKVDYCDLRGRSVMEEWADDYELANALAEELIHLIGQGLIDPKTV